MANLSKVNSRSNVVSKIDRRWVAILFKDSKRKIIASKHRGTRIKENKGSKSKLMTGDITDIVEKLAAVAG